MDILIKPVSGNCNIQCSYCFYREEIAHRSNQRLKTMNIETIEALVRKALAEAEGVCSFSFQGGEPLLAPLRFYRQFCDMVNTCKPSSLQITYTLQTNGILLNEEWCDFFKEQHFLLGVSLDGIPRIHNLCRKTLNGEPTFSQVMNGIDLLKKYRIPFHILCVVTDRTVPETARIYQFFKKNNLRSQQYIPCLNPLYASEEASHTNSLSAKGYTKFMKTLFDCWYEDMLREDYVYIRYFENLAGMLKGFSPEHCGMMGVCGEQWVVEADGSVYPCDFYALDSSLLGNINKDTFSEMRAQRMLLPPAAGAGNLQEKCSHCQWFPLCRNGCPREREPVNQENLYRYCESQQEIFPYILKRLKTLL